METKSQSQFNKFLILWSGELISAIGSGLTSFGIGVYIFQQTGKASMTALVTLLAFMPGLVLSAPAGVLADRYDRRIMMMLGDGLSGLGILFILICMIRGELMMWQICIGVTISSVFSALLEPAYKATVTDLLTKDQYTKASGLVGVAGSAKYLISPVIAGFLLAVSNIKLLLVIDICTFFITVISTLVVRRGIITKKLEQGESFICEFKNGWNAISQNNGVLVLVILSSAITFFLGFIQTLSTPMLLDFTDSTTLGVTETICASGMLVSSILIGIFTIKRGYTKTLSISLFIAGIFMIGFGLRENIIIICISGFLFFAMLPFANMSLDFLIRTNIKNDFQGRVWGIVGVISQLGYVIAYTISGILADGLGSKLGMGVGRGSALAIAISGALLSVTAIILYRVKSIRLLEKRGEL